MIENINPFICIYSIVSFPSSDKRSASCADCVLFSVWFRSINAYSYYLGYLGNNQHSRLIIPRHELASTHELHVLFIIYRTTHTPYALNKYSHRQ